MQDQSQDKRKEIVGEAPLWQVDGVPESEGMKEMPTREELWESNKRLNRMYHSARDEIERLEAIMNPKVRHQTIIDCTDAKQSEMEGAGWEVVHRQFMQKGPLAIVLCVVFRKPIDDQPPTPPSRLMVPVVSEASENRHSTKQEDDERDDRPAARRVIGQVVELPTMRIVGRGAHPDLPTFDKQKLNEIAVGKAMDRVMAVMNGGNAS